MKGSRLSRGKFRNPVQTNLARPRGLWRAVGELRRTTRSARYPTRPPSVARPPASAFAKPPGDGVRVTWLGHSAVILELDGYRLVTDPMLEPRATLVRGVGPKRFFPAPLEAGELPQLDAVVISHDHPDHLDPWSIRALAPRTRHFVCPLGVGVHLVRWGVPATQVTELDWWQDYQDGELVITAGPARHFSGRSLWGRDRTLWASWSIRGGRHAVFFSGDSGPMETFSEIGTRLGPFDLTMIQVGAYGDGWPDVHLTPEEGLAVHSQVRGHTVMPIHWGTFNLALHPWNEPPERLLAGADPAGTPTLLPRPGIPSRLTDAPAVDPWWR